MKHRRHFPLVIQKHPLIGNETHGEEKKKSIFNMAPLLCPINQIESAGCKCSIAELFADPLLQLLLGRVEASRLPRPGSKSFYWELVFQSVFRISEFPTCHESSVPPTGGSGKQENPLDVFELERRLYILHICVEISI